LSPRVGFALMGAYAVILWLVVGFATVAYDDLQRHPRYRRGFVGALALMLGWPLYWLLRLVVRRKRVPRWEVGADGVKRFIVK